MKIHEKYINRCIELAANGLGTTYPNPLVGSVLVYNNRIIGEGWHQKAGKAHAEVNAINSVKDAGLLSKATIYVSLEPCSHFGRTPPCSDFIIAKGIRKVVIGTVDPFAKVAGKGIKKLLDAGCEVIVGVLEEKCNNLNKRFFTFHLKKRPYIILKWAQSINGFIAPGEQVERNPVWISNKYSKRIVHKWRSEEQCILVGTNTAVADNPQLDTRLWKGNNPTRIIIDQNLRIPQDSHIFDGSVSTILICGNTKKFDKQIKNLIVENINFEDKVAQQICEIAYKHNLQSLIVEGGSQTLTSFIDENVWDEARVFTGNAHIKTGIPAPKFEGNLFHEESIMEDQLKIYLND